MTPTPTTYDYSTCSGNYAAYTGDSTAEYNAEYSATTAYNTGEIGTVGGTYEYETAAGGYANYGDYYGAGGPTISDGYGCSNYGIDETSVYGNNQLPQTYDATTNPFAATATTTTDYYTNSAGAAYDCGIKIDQDRYNYGGTDAGVEFYGQSTEAMAQQTSYVDELHRPQQPRFEDGIAEGKKISNSDSHQLKENQLSHVTDAITASYSSAIEIGVIGSDGIWEGDHRSPPPQPSAFLGTLQLDPFSWEAQEQAMKIGAVVPQRPQVYHITSFYTCLSQILINDFAYFSINFQNISKS